MERETLFERLTKLLQKSRKAVRLYSGMGKINVDGRASAETQLREWRELNSMLVSRLITLLESPNARLLAPGAQAIRDEFYSIWRESEAVLVRDQRSLVLMAEKGDFLKCQQLADMLIAYKSRTEASHAVYHEINEVLRKSGVAERTISLEASQILKDRELSQSAEAESQLAKVIPIRKQVGQGR